MRRHLLHVRAWIALLVGLNSTACFRSLDDTKVRCTSSDHCPNNDICVAGRCVSRSTATLDGAPLDTVIMDVRDAVSLGEGDGGSETAGQKTDTDTGRPDTIVIAPVDAATEAGPESPTDNDASPDLPQPIEAPPADAPNDPVLPPPDRGPDYPLDHPVGPDLGLDVGPDVPYVPEAGPDLALTSCVIGGNTYASGAANPANTCQVCKLATSTSAWSNADEGDTCGSGQYCSSGTCKTGCFVSGAYYANAAANPANACQTCQTAYAATSWTTSANGATCGTGQVCNGGTCQGGCWIDGAIVARGTTNQANA
jgi:hypothetical protein